MGDTPSRSGIVATLPAHLQGVLLPKIAVLTDYVTSTPPDWRRFHVTRFARPAVLADRFAAAWAQPGLWGGRGSFIGRNGLAGHPVAFWTEVVGGCVLALLVAVSGWAH